MDGKVQYASLEEAIRALVNQAQGLDDPIDNYMKQQSQIGEPGAAAWGGTAAERVIPVLSAIKYDIIELQNACNEFAEDAGVSLENYQTADVQAEQTVTEVKA